MPAKKNARKRTRNNNDSSGPPKKRVKKVSKKKAKNDSLRRSSRSHQKPSEWWKTSKSHNQNDDDDDNDSDTSENIYLPPVRRNNTNKINKNKNNKSSDKEEKEECNEESTQNTDSDDTNDTNDSSHNNNQNNDINNTSFNLLSPHKKQNIDDLPQEVNVRFVSNDNHKKIMKKLFSNIDDINDNDNDNDNNIYCIKNVLKESSLLKKAQYELTQKMNKEYNALYKNGEIERNELNKNISDINNKYVASQKLLERNMEKVLNKMNEINDKNNENGNEEDGTENKYKILYETSMKKIKLLNDDIINLQNELRAMKDDKLKENKKTENMLIDVENNKNKEINDLKRKYLIEINDLKLQLSCNMNEFNEYKQKINEKDIIFTNNNNLLIDNLKRENNALSDELAMYRKNNDNNRTLTPNNFRDYSDYNNHILQSPLNDRNKNELISISNAKDLENKIKNLNQEIESFKQQLFAKKELIKEFQISLQNNHIQQKDFLNRLANHKKIINLYEILTCTKIEANNNNNNNKYNNKQIREEQYKCRTKNKETDSMLEYYLSLDEKQEKSSFCDYYLIGSHNLLKPLNESLQSNITFYTKDAPLFLKGIIHQIFINKK